jgi:hypothetical protein
MTISRELPQSLLVMIGVTLASFAVACGGAPANAPASSVAADSPSTSATSAPELNGTYTATGESTGTSTWTITPCGEGCADIAVKAETADAAGDTLALPFTGQAHLDDDGWSMTTIRTDGYVCDDGTEVAVDAIYSWNAVSLKGSWDATLHEPGCGKPAGSGTGEPEPFTLTKVSGNGKLEHEI